MLHLLSVACHLKSGLFCWLDVLGVQSLEKRVKRMGFKSEGCVKAGQMIQAGGDDHCNVRQDEYVMTHHRDNAGRFWTVRDSWFVEVRG